MTKGGMTVKKSEQLLQLIKEAKPYITAQSLSQALKTTQSAIRKMIAEHRRNGIPICSTRKGYYYSTKPSDIASTIRFLKNRLNTQLQAICGLENISIIDLINLQKGQ